MALLIGAALLVAQLVNFTLILSERQKLSLAQNQGPAITRFVSTAADLANAAPEFRQPLLEDASRRGAQFALASQSNLPADAARDADVEDRVRQSLTQNNLPASEVRAAFSAFPRTERSGRGERRGDVQLLLVSAHLADGWLNARLVTPRPDPWLAARLGSATLLLYLIVLGATLVLAGRIARPLRALTEAAERFGGREAAPEVAPRGPVDLRRAIEAFNAMNRRVVSLLDEKDRMLGAIGHDLRTPLASLRIRAETALDDEDRNRMVATIEEMTATLEDILVLARTGRAREEARKVDVTALVDAVAEEFRELGRDVEMVSSERSVAHVQPALLRRAVRNLVDNAVKYGGSARVAVRGEDGRVLIEVTDRGPGLPSDQLTRAAEPFYRGEASRNRETGGTGLGLAIAAAVAESHAGALRLANRPEGGLVATLEIPN
jgi:signal transduction histidine kinase